MATPAGPISTAPAAPAPSVAPASAPSSAPAAPVSQPASGGGTAGLETGATTAQPPAGGAGAAPAAAPAAATPQGPPKNTDFPNSTEGQLAFLAADKRWQAEHPEGAAAPASQAAAVPPAGQPDAIPAEAQPAAEQPKPGEAAPVEPPTPQALDELLTKTPELKAVLDKPEMKAAKDAIFESARRAAELEPIAAIVPTVADAEFMQEHTAALVGLKTASMRAANDPALIPQVLDQLDQQFAIVDKDGKPVLGPDGKPQFAADRAPFIDGIVNREMNVARTKITGDVAALKAKLASGVYPNEAAKARDQAKLDNLEFAEIALKAAEQIRSGEFFQDAVPQIPQDASPEFRSWAEAETKRIADERKALEDQRTGANRDANKATATQFASVSLVTNGES